MYHDPTLISQFGDDLERHVSQIILNKIPSYSTIWATYIGNNGKHEFLKMPNAESAGYVNREKIWQKLYTLFESLALCWEIEEQFKRFEKISNHADYTQNLNLWMAFYAHIGRIHDMAQKISTDANEEALYTDFKDFYQTRNIVVHGPKIPMCWVENVLCSPPLGEGSNQWHDKMKWRELKKADFDMLSNRVANTLRDIEKITEAFCKQLLGFLPRLQLSPIDWSMASEEGTNQQNATFSGTQSCAPFTIYSTSGNAPQQRITSGSD